MTLEEIDRIRRSSVLLPPPGGEVVRYLLEVIERLQKENNNVEE